MEKKEEVFTKEMLEEIDNLIKNEAYVEATIEYIKETSPIFFNWIHEKVGMATSQIGLDLNLRMRECALVTKHLITAYLISYILYKEQFSKWLDNKLNIEEIESDYLKFLNGKCQKTFYNFSGPKFNIQNLPNQEKKKTSVQPLTKEELFNHLEDLKKVNKKNGTKPKD